MNRLFEIALFAAILAIATTQGEPPAPACKVSDFENAQDNVPPIPAKFFTRIESNLHELKRSLEAHEFRIDNEQEGNKLDINFFHAKDRKFDLSRNILDLKSDEADHIGETFGEAWKGSCGHRTADQKPKNDFFGLGENPTSGTAFSLTGAFELLKKHKFKKDDQDSVYIRGIPSISYETCIPLEGREKETVVHTTIYFSDPSKWTEADGTGKEIPLRIQIHGTGVFVEDGKMDLEEISHVYEITNFMESYVHENDDSYFTPPAHVYCENRKPVDQVKWTVPNIFEMDVELIGFKLNEDGQFEHEFVNEYRQFFDQNHKYDRFDFEGDRKQFAPNVTLAHPMTVIHDFNTGHAYEIHRRKETCVISKLTVESGWDVSVGDGKLTVFNPWQFLSGQDVDFSYQGVHTHRGVSADVYAFPSDDPTTGKKLISLFTLTDKVEDDETVAPDRQGPLHMRIKRMAADTQEEIPPFEMNIFDYMPEVPSLHAWNIGRCFKGPGQRKFLEFHLEGKVEGWDVERTRHLIYYEMVKKLHPVAQVVPIRIDNVRIIDETREKILVMAFELLDKPDFEGSLNPEIPNVPLKEAFEALQKSYHDLEFDVAYWANDELQVAKMKPVPGSLKDIEQAIEGGGSSGSGGGEYSGGAMAGLGIAMLLLGGGLAFGFIKFREYRSGNMAGLPKFSR